MNDDAQSSEALDDLVRTREVIVCIGGGGVGKTTLAASLAIRGAQLGRRSVVVTIDPARRLADALGLDALTNEPLALAAGRWADQEGSLAALMLDPKETFDNLVCRHAESQDQAHRILANRFYRTISGGLSGTQEYMAMEKLAALHASGDHDLIVIDTPPHRHALDFLDASEQLSRMLDNRLFRLVTVPKSGLLRSVNRAGLTLVRSLARIVGADVIDDAVTFFAAFNGMEEGFRRRSNSAKALLIGDATAFVLVCAPRQDAVADAAHLAGRLTATAIDVDVVMVNRVHPEFGDADPDELSRFADGLRGKSPLEASMVDNLASLRRIALSEREQVDQISGLLDSRPVITVPLRHGDIHDLDGLEAITNTIFT